MLSPKLAQAFNAQITAEFHSSAFYLSMAAWLETENLPGMARWMRLQADEERGHGLKFFEHLLQRGQKVALEAVAAPPAAFDGPEDIFKRVVEHEARVTGLVHALFETARADKDYASESFLKWFVDEQVEEEAQARLIHEQLRMTGGSKGGLLMMDHQLGKRAAA